MVAKVLTSAETLPTGSTLRTQAATLFLWTSDPARRAWNTSIARSPPAAPRTGDIAGRSQSARRAPQAPRTTRRRRATGSGTRDGFARLLRGLEAPVTLPA